MFDKEKNRRDRLAAYFYDLSKLVFAGTIIANIATLLNDNSVGSVNVYVLMLGIIATTFFAWIGNRILTYQKLKIMDGATLSALFMLSLVIISGSILAWTYTKSGKKWLANL